MDNKRKVNFLREYANFSLYGPLKSAECMHEKLIEAHSKKDFDSVALLLVKLHAEMVLSLESAGALLLSFSKWDQPGGLIKTLLTYKLGEVPDFLEKLFNSDNSLKILCFPEKKQVIKHIKGNEELEKYYNHDELMKLIKHIFDMYLNEIIRKLYNKVKHAGVVIRDLEVIGKRDIWGRTKIFIPTYNNEHDKIEFMFLSVVGEDSKKLADKYLDKIKKIIENLQGFTNLFVFFLERDLLTPSLENPDENEG